MATPEISYLVASYPSLGPGQRRDIHDLIRESVVSEHPNRTTEEVNFFMGHARRTRENPSRAIGGPIRRRRQSFSNFLSVLAIQDGELLAYLPIANNVSNSRRQVLDHPSRFQRARDTLPGQIAERQAKLHLGRYISSCHAWIGEVAMSDALRRQILEQPGSVNMFDALGVVALDTRHPDQPLSTWPRRTEEAYCVSLDTWGLTELSDDSSSICPFGPGTTSVVQTHWVASGRVGSSSAAHSVDEVKAAILAKPGDQDLGQAARAGAVDVRAFGTGGLTFV